MASIHRLVPVTVGLILVVTSPLRADVVFNLSSGYDNSSGELLPNGAPDKYVIAEGGTGGYWDAIPVVRTTPLPNGWLLDNASTDSRWLILDTGLGQEGVSAPGGTYFFDTYVDLTGFNASTALITDLRYAADNKLISVEINGIPVFTQDQTFAEEFGSFRTIGDVGLLLFEDGLNHIRFVVLNQEGVISPMGLRVEGLIEAEPATRLKPVTPKGMIR